MILRGIRTTHLLLFRRCPETVILEEHLNFRILAECIITEAKTVQLTRRLQRSLSTTLITESNEIYINIFSPHMYPIFIFFCDNWRKSYWRNLGTPNRLANSLNNSLKYFTRIPKEIVFRRGQDTLGECRTEVGPVWTKQAIRPERTGFLPVCHSQLLLVFATFLYQKRLLFTAFQSREYIQS